MRLFDAMKEKKVLALLLAVCLVLFCSILSKYAYADIPSGVKDQYEYNQHDSSIIQVKTRLKELGYFSSKAQFSDFVSDELKKAVISFQRQNGMKANGVIDKDFLLKLYSSDAIDKDGKKRKATTTATPKTKVTNQPVKKGTSQIDHQNRTVLHLDSNTFILIFIFAGMVGLIVLIGAINTSRPKAYNIQNELIKIDNMSGVEFEKWSSDLLKHLGYRNVRTTKATGDFGADIICSYNGGSAVVQCKRYEKTVGLKPVQEVLGAKTYYKANRMLVITNSHYSSGAIKLAQGAGVILWDRNSLINLMKKYNRLYAREYRKQKSESQETVDYLDNQDVYIENSPIPKKNEMKIKNEYQVTVKRRYDGSTYMLYRLAVSENEAMKLVNSIIDANETIIDVQLIRSGY